MSRVADNANDLKRALFCPILTIDDDMLAEGLSSLEEFFHKGFVHHHDRHPLSAVAMVKSASGQEWNVHRAKVITHHSEMRRIRMVAETGIGPARHPKRGGPIITRKWQRRHSAGSFNSGKGMQTIIQSFEEFLLLQC